jgi:hypothetical protein
MKHKPRPKPIQERPAYKQPTRNYARVHHAKVRELWDAHYTVASDAISDAYYRHWRQGEQQAVSLHTVTLNIGVDWKPARITTFFRQLERELNAEYWKGFQFFNNSLGTEKIPPAEWNHLPDATTRTGRATAVLNNMETAGNRKLKEYFDQWR